MINPVEEKPIAWITWTLKNSFQSDTDLITALNNRFGEKHTRTQNKYIPQMAAQARPKKMDENLIKAVASIPPHI